MKTIYLDSEYICHTDYDPNYIPYITNIFDGKCDRWIESYRFIPENAVWVRRDGESFSGPMLTPAYSYTQAKFVQDQYEEDQENMMALEDVADLIDALYEADLDVIG